MIVGVQLLVGLFFGFYRGWWRYVGMSDVVRLVLGLSVMFVLAPSTRFGYFIYPAALVLWLLASQAGRALSERPAPELVGSASPPSG